MDTREAFELVVDKLVDVAADKRLLEKERGDLRAKIHDLELSATQMKRDLNGAKADKDLVVKNYEKLKAMVPAKMLAEHEKAIDDIPF